MLHPSLLIKNRDLPPSHLTILSPFQPYQLTTFPLFPPYHLTTLHLLPLLHISTLPSTNKALQNNNIGPSVSPHIVLNKRFIISQF